MDMLFAYYPLYVKWNHGVALLTAILKEHGIKADYTALDSEFESKIKDYKTIGFSFVTDKDYQESIPYMKIAKAAGKEILAGGVYARRGAYIDPSLVDHICRGEGEILWDYLINKDERIFNEPYYQKDLDKLPMPDLSNVTGYEFHRGWDYLKGLKIIPYQTSRGCPYKCTFCEVQFQPSGLRIKHTIYKNLIHLMETYNPDLIYLFDEQPPYYSKEWRDQWQDLNIPFVCYIRADIEPKELDFMVKHGMKAAAFGVESGSQEYRNKVLKKNLTNAQIFRTVDLLKKNDIFYMPFFMAGLPGESYSDRRATQLMMYQLGGMPIVWEYQDLRASICQSQ
jgi:anaerobic magnesium-protoporphyrin IX monomethyl ester cyclase